jgi:heptosyltransferase I
VRVLVTRLSALGDIIHTWPLAVILKDTLPGVSLAWLVEKPFVPLVASHPAVDRVLVSETRAWRRHPFAPETRRSIRLLKDELADFAADVWIDPQGLMKSALWGFLSKASERIGFAWSVRRDKLVGAMYTTTVQPAPELCHIVDLNLSLLRPIGVEPRYGAQPDGRFLLSSAQPRPSPQTGCVALLPATGGEGKAWSVADFATLAQDLAKAGQRVMVFWGPGEKALADNIVESAGHGAVHLAPATTIVELAIMLSSCAVVVGGDTGPVHLAASLGIPTVAIFLSTNPERNGPRGQSVWVVNGAAQAKRRDRARTRPYRPVNVAEVTNAVDAALRASQK